MNSEVNRGIFDGREAGEELAPDDRPLQLRNRRLDILPDKPESLSSADSPKETMGEAVSQSSPKQAVVSDEGRPRFLDDLLKTVPESIDYASHVEQLERLNADFRQRFADRLSRVLNAHLSTVPQHAIDQKRSIVHEVNVELKKFDMAIRLEKDGIIHEAFLVVHTDKYTPQGRFRLEYRDSDGKHRTLYEEKVPPLDLMPASIRSDGFSKMWATRSAEPGGTKSVK